MPTVKELLKKQAKERAGRESATTRELLREYGRLDKALGGVYSAFAKDLDEEKGRRGEGEKGRVQVSWLHKNKRLTNLLTAVNTEIAAYGARAAAIIERDQKSEAEGQKKASAQILKLLGIDNAKIPPGESDSPPGRMGDGRKIADHFSKNLAQAVSGRVRAAAVNSVAAESAPVSKKLKAAHGIILGRTLSTSRTETMRAVRAVSQDIYKRNGIKWLVWHSNLGPKTCEFCRKLHGTRHRIGTLILSHPRCRCIWVPDGGPDISVRDRVPAHEPVKETFTGTIRGENVTFPDVPMRSIRYTKRADYQRNKLRSEFDREKTGARTGFLKSLVDSSDKVARLRHLGVPDWLIENMKGGKLGTMKWQVHHKLPLDDGGTNNFDNLILIKNDPLHIAITNYQKATTRSLAEGQTIVITFPVPQGSVYANGGTGR